MSPLDEGTFCYGSDQVVADFVARELFDSKKESRYHNDSSDLSIAIR